VEAVVVTKRRWGELSKRTRRLIVVGGVAETALKAAALVDLKRRPAEEIRGSKPLWATVVVVVNAFGLVPLSYFAFARRASSGQRVEVAVGEGAH
jgi:hypothetical protein